MLRNQNETNELFDGWARTYDKDLKNASGPLFGYDHSIAQAAQMTEVGENEKMLDIGIGTGTFAALISGENAEVWGVDPSSQMLDQCKVKHPDYHLRQGTFTETTITNEQFNHVISSFCFHEVSPKERDKALLEMLRLLKPGGKFLLLDIMFVSEAAQKDSREKIGKYWDETEDYPQVAQLDVMIRQTGFTNIRWTNTAPYHWAVTGRKKK